MLESTQLRSSLVGAKVVNSKTGKTIFELNSDKLLHPASTLKLFTTAAALHYLGKDFSVKTEIFLDEKRNLIIKGNGNSLLRTEHYETIAQKIIQQGIKNIQHIIIDVSYFDDNSWGKGWMWDDEPGASAMHISPLCVNGNVVNVIVTPNKVNEKPFVELDPRTSYFTLLNESKTVSAIDNRFPLFEVTRKWKERENIIVVKGQLPATSLKDTFSVNVWKPEFYAGTLLKERLNVGGVQITGEIKRGTSENSKKIFLLSHPLDSLIHKANKESDNLSAECLLKILAAEKNSIPGIADSGIHLEKIFYSLIGIDTSNMIIADGSGASDYNLVSVNHVISLLQYQFKQSTFKSFKESLPIAGVDGTLKNRMKGTHAEGKVFAKTGTKRGINSLAGYIEKRNGEVISFAIIINHFSGEIKTLRKIIDAFVLEITK